MQSIDTILTDCDGVLWLENFVIDGSPETIDLLRKMGKKVYFVTNNSTKNRNEFLGKLEKMGFTASQDEALCTSYLTACYFQEIGFKGKAYVIGEKGLCEELQKVGITHPEIGPDVVNTGLVDLVGGFKKDPEIKAVVIGFDLHYNFVKMLKACSYLKDPNCSFIATNTDERFPMNTENVVPGTGCIVAAVEKCAGRNAVKIGKPNDFLREVLIKHHNVDPKRTLMIGDRGNTDILLGTRCGFKTLLVLTGVTSLEEVHEWQKSDDPEVQKWVPDFYLDRLKDLSGLLNKCICSTPDSTSKS
ncbi:Hydrolase [Gryllus bimaculatus]|nr:Hydrolase [Gryllus bimaculatus]